MNAAQGETDRRMDVEEIQRQIDATDYWDAQVYDLRVSFFGDEILMFMECDEENLWRFRFEVCNAAEYHTDAYGRKKWLFVKDREPRQMGYYAQSFNVLRSDTDGFLRFDIDLSAMTIRIECMFFTVSRVPRSETRFWWSGEA